MEWLFLTCHNYWIVCRLVRDDEHPFEHFSAPSCPLSKMFPSGLANSIHIWHLILLLKKTMFQSIYLVRKKK